MTIQIGQVKTPSKSRLASSSSYPRYYAQQWKAGKAFFAQHPNGVVRVPWRDNPIGKAAFEREMRTALHYRINARGGLLDRNAKNIDMHLDRRTIEDYLFRRIRHSGCSGLLRTKQMRKRYPHINKQPFED